MHNQKLQAKLSSMTFKPIESCELLSLTHLLDTSVLIGNLTHQKELESMTTIFGDTEALVKQLTKSISVAAADMRKAVKDDAKTVKKREQQLKKKEEEQAKESRNVQERQERLRLALLKMAVSFKLKLTELGFPEMSAIESQTAWIAGKTAKPAAFFTTPTLLNNSHGFTNMCKELVNDDDTSAAAKLQQTLARFLKTFPRNDECLRNGKVVCSLYANMGLDVVKSAFEDLVSDEDCVKSALPSYQALKGVQLYGSLKDAVHFGIEATCMGSLWYQVTGVTKFILTPASPSKRSKRVPRRSGRTSAMPFAA